MTSQTRMRMNQEVQSDTPHLRAVSRRLRASAMHSANAIQAAGPSLEAASSEPVLAENVRARPRHSRLREPSAPRPFRAKRGQPQSRQRSGSPKSPASSAAIAALSSPRSPSSSSSSSSRVIRGRSWDAMSRTGLPSVVSSWSMSTIVEGPSLRAPETGLCQSWFNREIGAKERAVG